MRKLLSGLGIKSKKILNFFGYLMNRNYTVNTRFGKKKTLKPDSNDKVFTSFSGKNTFSYKGIVVVKKGGCYTVKEAKLQGYASRFLSGVFTDARSLALAFDSALSDVDKDKHYTLRAKNQNIQCPHCRSIYLLYKSMQSEQYGEVYIECPHCQEVHPSDSVSRVTDDKIY